MVPLALRRQNFGFYLLNNVPNLEGSFVAAGVADPTGVISVVFDDAVTDSVQAARSGICGLALQVRSAGQTQGDSHCLTHASHPCPRNCGITRVVRQLRGT